MLFLFHCSGIDSIRFLSNFGIWIWICFQNYQTWTTSLQQMCLMICSLFIDKWCYLDGHKCSVQLYLLFASRFCSSNPSNNLLVTILIVLEALFLVPRSLLSHLQPVSRSAQGFCSGIHPQYLNHSPALSPCQFLPLNTGISHLLPWLYSVCFLFLFLFCSGSLHSLGFL